MTNRITLPGQPAIEIGAPSPGEQEIMGRLEAIHAQLGQVVMALNTLAGQLDTGLRLASGFYSKHEIKVKFEEHDAKIRALNAVAQKSNTNEEGDSEQG